MASFTNFQNVLPDPNNSIGNAGQSTGSYGPGYASVSVTSEQPMLRDSTNSGRILARSVAAQKWNIKITYNPMTREEFEPVYTFLLQRRGPINPFYVSLPQYRVPRDSTFATYAASNNLESANAVTSGATSALIGRTGYSNTTNKTPLPGDMFTISGANSNHKKAYMVTRIETTADYLSSNGAPASTQVRVHFVPGLSKALSIGDDFVFHNPLVKVIMTGDVQEYSLNTNNLYSFSLNLEEVQ